MSYMFEGASAFNSDLSNWNTENVTNISYMFNGASAFNSDLSSWNTSKFQIGMLCLKKLVPLIAI